MSPQNYNVIVELCGLSISHLYKPNLGSAVWETVVLEETGAPKHGGDHQFEMTWPDGFTGQQTAQDLPAYYDRVRTIVITPEKCHTPPSEYRPQPIDDASIEHIGDFSSFEQQNGYKVNFDPSKRVHLTKVKVYGGEGYSSRLADGVYNFNSGPSKQLGKCLAFRMQCEVGSLVNIATANNSGEAFDYSLQVDGVKPLVIQLHNDCDNSTETVDFPFFYNDGFNSFGIVDPRNQATLNWIKPPQKEILSGKVACNAMLASKLETGGSLWDAVGM